MDPLHLGGIASTMQGNRENSNNTFDSGFGFPGSIFGGGRDPFDDPFFARPYGSLFGSNLFSSSSRGNLQQTGQSKGPVIEELDSDDEGEPVENDATNAAWRNRNPLVEHPEDQANEHGKSSSNERDISYSTNHDNVEVNRQQPRSVSFQRVTYGGINGAYYTATTSRRTGNDGVTVEESRQADKTTGQATHRISRGLHDKALAVPDPVDWELGEDLWIHSESILIEMEGRASKPSLQRRPKKVVRINIE
ncbi:hypothetical protein DH2020_002350 [Rehmannia glutinosa]|uniref:Uncharacterized protein n=1 Tax=Rehmannia glutinosa TaxID=99300 RepID=A0ABR0XU56_REHGL